MIMINLRTKIHISTPTKAPGKHKTDNPGKERVQSTSLIHPAWTFHTLSILVYLSIVRSVGFLDPICLLLECWAWILRAVECDVHYVVPGFAGDLRRWYPGFLGGWDARWPAFACLLGIVMFMSDLMGLDDEERRRQVTEQVRAHNTAKIHELIAQLEPYVSGFNGPPNPALVRSYLEALKALAQLWRVFDKPEVVEVVEDKAPEIAAERARAEVLLMLESMARKSGSDEPPSP